MEMVKFKATPEQIRQIGANAANASKPMGMGHLQFQKDNQFFGENFKLPTDEFHLDYVQGRMVKLNIWKKEDHWEMRNEATPDYQSWCDAYPTARELIQSVPGVEILN